MVGLLIFLQKWLQSHKTGLVIGQRYSRWEGDTLNDWSNWLDNEVRSQLWCFALFPLDWHIQCTVNGSWLRPRDDVGMQKRNAKRNKQKIQKMHNILFAFYQLRFVQCLDWLQGKCRRSALVLCKSMRNVRARRFLRDNKRYLLIGNCKLREL